MGRRISQREALRRAKARDQAAAEAYRAEYEFRLTPREADTLRLAARGYTYAEIGDHLGIGSETVKSHLRSARWLLSAKRTTEAVAEALRRGLLDAQPSDADRPPGSG